MWTKNDGSKLPSVQVKKIKNVLNMLDSAVVVEDMDFQGRAFIFLSLRLTTKIKRRKNEREN